MSLSDNPAFVAHKHKDGPRSEHAEQVITTRMQSYCCQIPKTTVGDPSKPGSDAMNTAAAAAAAAAAASAERDWVKLDTKMLDHSVTSIVFCPIFQFPDSDSDMTAAARHWPTTSL